MLQVVPDAKRYDSQELHAKTPQKTASSKPQDLSRGFGGDLAKIIFPFLKHKEVANFVQAQKSLHKRFAVSKCGQFLQLPSENLLALLSPHLHLKEVVNLVQVNKAWNKHTMKQKCLKIETMEQAHLDSMYLEAVHKGEKGLVNLFLNLEVKSRIKISPSVQGEALLFYAEGGDLKMMNLILDSGSILEGELLDQPGFSENDASQRSAVIYRAVQKGNLEILLLLLKNRSIIGCDSNLVKALLEAVGHGDYLIVDLLLKYIGYNEAAIQNAEKEVADVSKNKSVILNLLSQYRLRKIELI